MRAESYRRFNARIQRRALKVLHDELNGFVDVAAGGPCEPYVHEWLSVLAIAGALSLSITSLTVIPRPWI